MFVEASPHPVRLRPSSWVGVQVRHLQTLAAVAAAGSFSDAGAVLGYAQSTISQHVAALEAAVGATLIERSRGSRLLALTPAGEALCRHANVVAASLRAAQQEVDALRGTTVAPVVVACSGALGVRIAGEALARAVVREPVRVMTAPRSEVLHAVRRGDAELGLVETPAAGSDLCAELLLEDEQVLIAPAAETRVGATVTAATLASLPMVGATVSADADLTARALVAAGAGCALVAASTAETPSPAIRVARLDPPSLAPRVRVTLVWRRDPPLTDRSLALLDAVRSAAARIRSTR